MLQSRVRRPDRPRHSQRQSDLAGRHPHVSGQVHRRVRREAARPAEGGAAAAGPAAVAAAKRSRSPCPSDGRGEAGKTLKQRILGRERRSMGDRSRRHRLPVRGRFSLHCGDCRPTPRRADSCRGPPVVAGVGRRPARVHPLVFSGKTRFPTEHKKHYRTLHVERNSFRSSSSRRLERIEIRSMTTPRH